MEEEKPVNIPNKSRSLRARSVQKRLQTELNKDVPKQRDPRQKDKGMSKYRRKTANAKERDRMKFLNDAFERLRKVIPDQKVMLNEDKSTKVTTLRCAITYINSLQQLIDDCVAGNIQPESFQEDADDSEPHKAVTNNKPVKSKSKKSKAPITTGNTSGKIKTQKITKPPAQKSKSCRVILPLKGGASNSGAKVDTKTLWNPSGGRPEVLRDLPPNSAAYNGLIAPQSTVTFSHRDPTRALLSLKPLSFSSLFPGKAPPKGTQGLFQEKDGSQEKSLVAENCISTQNNSHQMMKFKLVPPAQNGAKTVKIDAIENSSSHKQHTTSHKYQSKHPFPPHNTTKFVRSNKFLEEKQGEGSLFGARDYQYSSNEISVQISLIKDPRNGHLEDSMEEVSDQSDNYSENSESDLPDSPTDIIPSIDQLFKRSFSYELDEIASSSPGDHLMELDDIQQILKEAENFDVYM